MYMYAQVTIINHLLYLLTIVAALESIIQQKHDKATRILDLHCTLMLILSCFLCNFFIFDCNCSTIYIHVIKQDPGVVSVTYNSLQASTRVWRTTRKYNSLQASTSVWRTTRKYNSLQASTRLWRTTRKYNSLSIFLKTKTDI